MLHVCAHSPSEVVVEQGSGAQDWADDFPDDTTTTEDLHDFTPTLPTTSDVVYSHFKRVVRYLSGSNCVLIERGEVPIYEQCYGCSMREAFACLQDMRNNVTGNVPPGCTIEAISEKPDTGCCPKFVNHDDGTHGKVLFEYSAYPMAFECLKEVGCEDTEIFTNLVAECYHVCDGVKNLYNNDIFFTCTAIPSPAMAHSPSAVLLAASLVLAVGMQVLY
eukprot:CAMPEP_0114424162 /NCGR_PEP_ID=MMETSP0103-20121206/6543_1 /TAXON_ID=37642 ORGANISM="Paraphysomonas imperforata, Strain PA2" /NCGR_SAMPLE_ID=MMETSP0103 /ASSEMBLY_ACC=CAM_ASM_000201 /LENGTH=218 /DNA_ID=CAMNT_0001592889 /DNA_START=213 /DNA_END=869 /DNA_ORIENTATION=+